MRKLAVLLVCIATVLGLCISASATTGISSMTSSATVSSDGSCQVNSTVTLHLDSPVDKLTFPVPEEASAIALNGSRVLAQVSGNVRTIDLSRTVGKLAGDFTFAVSYRLPDLVSTTEDGLLHLDLPVLSGFSYPVQALELTVVMPGPLDSKPGFTSGYHQTNIEKDLSFTVDGATIIARSQKPMKDHETLSMVMTVSSEMFPQSVIYTPNLTSSNTAAIVCAVLAFLYWLLFLRCLVPFGQKRSTPPAGFSAGEMSSVLYLQGADLTLMVLSWAQLGYLILYHDPRGRVILHKQMEMGNERSSFERRCFNHLFDRKNAVDTASIHYVQLHQKIAATKPNVQGFIKKGSGNVRILRFLCSLIGLFCGISLGVILGAEAAAQWLVVIICAAFGFFSFRHIQTWVYSLMQQDKSRLWVAAALCFLWIVLGLISQLVNIALWAVAAAVGFGLLGAFAGRRSPDGRQAMAEVFGLRRYLLSVSEQDIQRLCKTNPDYFHDLAPYALALDAHRQFAKKFGGQHHACPYVVEDRELLLTDAQWSSYLELIVNTMNARIQHQPIEKILRIIRSFTK